MIRTIGATVGIVLLASAVVAETQENCEIISGFANDVMHARQVGVPLKEALAVLDKPAVQNFKSLFMPIVISAYEQSRYNDEDIRRQVVQDFTDQTLLSCLKGE